MMYTPQGREVVSLWVCVALLLLLAYWLISTLGAIGNAFDFFFVPIVVAVFFLRYQGLVVLVPSFILYCFALGNVQDYPSLYVCVSSGLFEALEWLFVSLILIVTIKSYQKLHRSEEDFRRDLAMARTLQMALIPPDYDKGTVRITGRVQQCREVGGDYCYFRPFQSHKVLFCLGDVMGKGIPSSMVTSIIMGFVYEWGKQSSSPAEVITNLNSRLVDLWGKGSFFFTTIFYAVYDEETQVLTYTTGGHHDAVLMHPDGKSEMLRTDGGLVGAVDCLTWTDKQVKMEPGDRVVVFTDGVTEARDKEGKMFTLERAAKAIRKARTSSIQGITDSILNAVCSYSDGVLEDDVAILVMEVKKP